KYLVEKTVGDLHDVVLHHAGHLFTAVGAGVFVGVAHDKFGPGAGDKLHTVASIARLAVLNAGVKVFFVFADDDHVHVLVLAVHKTVKGAHGAHVGKLVKALAQRYV